MIGIMLAIAVLSVWLGCIGFARLPTSYARLHCSQFVVIAAGLPLVLASIAADGPSDRTLKIFLLLMVLLLSGAALSHAIGRAIALREMSEPEP